MNTLELYILISIIGISTYFIRVIYFVINLNLSEKELIKRGLEVVPPSMLVALVIPFTLFDDQSLDLFRIEVAAILLSLPIIYKSRKFGYGLVICFIIYGILASLQNIT
ncbi:MAG: AzlD domain-containing protein [Candidatus Kariarchaeaceae archaeon]|jgi:branched-subunit amino acid transport protein